MAQVVSALGHLVKAHRAAKSESERDTEHLCPPVSAQTAQREQSETAAGVAGWKTAPALGRPVIGGVTLHDPHIGNITSVAADLRRAKYVGCGFKLPDQRGHGADREKRDEEMAA